MSRPTALVGIVFEERLDFGVVEFVGGHDAVILTLRSVLPLRRLQHRINVDDTLPRLR